MKSRTALATTRALQIALDALLALLLVLTLAVAIEQVRQVQPSDGLGSDGSGWLGIAYGLAFGAVYVTGRRRVRISPDVDAPRGQWWPTGVWACALIALWAALLSVVDIALWLAFPLMFLQMHVLGPRRGPIAVAVTTGISVWGALLQGLAPVGSVLGPVLGAAVAVGVVLGLEAVVRESQSRLAVIAELTRTRADLAAAEAERATIAERERLAREIHDTLAQGFSSIGLLLRAADRALDVVIDSEADVVRKYLSTAQEAVHENLVEARRVVRALAPPALDSANLVGALERLASRTQASAGIEVSTSATGDAIGLPAPIETALLRVAQSALANVVQHAGATRAQITVTFHDEEVSLDVVDNGHGFDPSAVRSTATGGFGISAMRSRVAELGGTLTIESDPGTGSPIGTALAVQIPVPREGASPDSTEGTA